ncbi:MAG: IS5 family transposase, partial [Candidatus Aenigmarchaeota archaeon]|nr:IS5 family transposase [Candidatus Aenigmarchaeota archaeon]
MEITMNGGSKYIILCRLCLQSCRQARIRKYSCKKSKHAYTQHQLITIYALMKYTKSHYRNIIDLLEVMPEIRHAIGFGELPHFTTTQKFIQRFGDGRIDRLISVQTKHIHEAVLGIDASGFSSDYASVYYTLRIKGKISIKKHVKNTICIDTFRQMIVSSIVSIGPKNDNRDFVPVLEKSATHPVVVVADKGYDSNANHKFVDSKKSVSMIPVKKNVRRGKYRWKMHALFLDPVYHRRSLTETVFSAIKRKFGEYVYARSEKMQVVEVSFMNFVYNLHRLVQVQV